MIHTLGIMVFVKTSHIQGGTMSHHKHLTPIEREKIFLLHSQNKTLNVNSKFQNNFKIIKFSNCIMLFSLFDLLFI